MLCTGAYGAAVLYRKKDDDSLVILKEINMHELNANERQMALNEVYKFQHVDELEFQTYVYVNITNIFFNDF